MLIDSPNKKAMYFLILSFFLIINSIISQNWMSIDRLISSDWEAGDNIGISVAIDGDFMITGAWWEDNIPFVNSAGAAYIFKKDNMDNWSEVLKLESPNAEVLGYFGFSVAIDGDYAVIGAYNEDEDDGTNVFINTGAVYVYHREMNDSWVMEQRLIASDFGEGDLFGYNLAISGTYIVIGAFSEDDDASGNNTLNNSGSAYIFERQPNGDWTEVEKLVASDRAEGDDFGKFVDIRGDRAIIGAMNKDDAPNYLFSAGAAYIFERDINGNWLEDQKLLASDRGNFENFGWDVAIDGDKALIGARAEADLPGGGTAANTGTAYFFERNSNGVWEEVQKLYADDHSQNDFFGGALDLDGNIAVIGAEMEDEDPDGNNTVSGAGSAYIFERKPNGVWEQVQKVIGENRQFDDLFGASASVRDDQIAIGAWRADEPDGQDQVSDVGAAYIFKRNMPLAVEENSWSQNIDIFPNPSQGQLHLMNTSGKPLDLQLEVYDLFGKVIYKKPIVLNNSIEIFFDNIPSGIYLLSLKNDGSQFKQMKWMKL